MNIIHSFSQLILLFQIMQDKYQKLLSYTILVSLALICVTPIFIVILATDSALSLAYIGIGLTFSLLIYSSSLYRKIYTFRNHFRLEARYLQQINVNKLELRCSQKDQLWSPSFMYQLFSSIAKNSEQKDTEVSFGEQYQKTFPTLALPWVSLVPGFILSLGWVLWQIPFRTSLSGDILLLYWMAWLGFSIALLTEIIGISQRVSLFLSFESVREMTHHLLVQFRMLLIKDNPLQTSPHLASQPTEILEHKLTKIPDIKSLIENLPPHEQIVGIEDTEPTLEEPDTLEIALEPYTFFNGQTELSDSYAPIISHHRHETLLTSGDGIPEWQSLEPYLEELQDEPIDKEVVFLAKLTSVSGGKATLVMEPLNIPLPVSKNDISNFSSPMPEQLPSYSPLSEYLK